MKKTEKVVFITICGTRGGSCDLLVSSGPRVLVDVEGVTMAAALEEVDRFVRGS